MTNPTINFDHAVADMTGATAELLAAMRREFDARWDEVRGREAMITDLLGQPNAQTGKAHTRTSAGECYDASDAAYDVARRVHDAQLDNLTARTRYGIAKRRADYALARYSIGDVDDARIESIAAAIDDAHIESIAATIIPWVESFERERSARELSA